MIVLNLIIPYAIIRIVRVEYLRLREEGRTFKHDANIHYKISATKQEWYSVRESFIFEKILLSISFSL